MINNIEQKIIKFIDEKDLIQKNDRILIALSGGPDSVFLLHFLNKYKKRFKIELGAVHINHLLRGDESDKDEVFCRKICNELGLEYFSVRKNVKSFALKEKISLEEAGREIRYQVFESTAFKHKYNKIATAHNSNDNAETVLLNLIKGTGIKGISGIASKRNNIIRPVIKLTKDEILTYLNQKEISFRIDKSNLSSDYERNFLRNEIIPLIKKRLNPKLEDSLFNSTEVFKKISRKIDRETERFISTVKFRKKENLLELFPDKLKDLEVEFLGDFIKEAVKRNFSIQLSFNDVNKITLLFHAKTGKKINLSENLSAVKERKQILIFINSDKEEFSFDKKIRLNSSVKLEGKIIHIDRVLSSEVELSGDKNVEYISGDRCGENFRLRTWKEGDRFFPLGFNLKKGRTGSKKISDFLNEQKIPSILKKKQLVLTTQNNIVWVLGLRLDDRFKLTEKTKKIYRLCLK